MTEAQFIPGQGAGNILDGLNTGMSLMERAQQISLRRQQAQQQHEDHARAVNEYVAMAPARAAQAEAEISVAKNKVAGFAQAEALRKFAHDEMPSLRAEWMEAGQIDDVSERVNAQARVMGKAAKYESVGELAPEVNTWKEVLGHGFATSRTLEAIKLRGVAAEQLAEAKAQHAEQLAGAKAQIAELQKERDAEAKEKQIKMKADSFLDTQNLRNDGSADVARIRAASRPAGGGLSARIASEFGATASPAPSPVTTAETPETPAPKVFKFKLSDLSK